MIVNPKRILWPTDFSSLSLKAAAYARGFRDVFRAELWVVHVCLPPMLPTMDFPPAAAAELAPQPQELLRDATTRLRRLVGEQFEDAQRVRFEAVMGTPWLEVCNFAAKNAIDLIVIATHGRTGLQHVLMGSVAERIVQHAPCPVLVVKNVERDFTVQQEIQRAAVAV
jgi:nucleotide-binding universal stress UspA family protein